MQSDQMSLPQNLATATAIATDISSAPAAAIASPPTVPALKEWAVAIDALIHGSTVLLLRKGGIREQGGAFLIEHPQVLLYPTYEHQQPALLKPSYAQQVEPVASGWHPASILLRAWAEITQVFQIPQLEALSALLPLHIWNQQFATERWHWKPKQPLYGLALRVHLLTPPQELPYRAEYGGCKSWIQVPCDRLTDQSGSCFEPAPVLDDLEYNHRLAQIQQALNSAQPAG